MLSFSESQLGTVSAEVERRFLQRLSARLQADFPQEIARVAQRLASDPEPTLAATRTCLAYAGRVGARRTSDQAVIAALAVANMGGGGQLAWVREILEMNDDDGQAKLAAVECEIALLALRDKRAATLWTKLQSIRAEF